MPSRSFSPFRIFAYICLFIPLFHNASNLGTERPPKIATLARPSLSNQTPFTTFHTYTMKRKNNEVLEDDAAYVHEWLMMCLPGSDGTPFLHQAMFTCHAEETFTNSEFCHLLKHEYETMRSRSSLGFLSPRDRKLKDIRFVKFQTKETTHGTPPRCPRVEVRNDRCLPEGVEGWVCGNPLAIFCAELIMVLGLNGKAVHERLSVHKMVPRKLGQPINPAESGSYGWGLYFVEKEYCKGWYEAVVLLATLVFAYVGGIVLALGVASAFGSMTPGDEFRMFRGIFAMYCFAFSFYHLGAFPLTKEDERVWKSGHFWAAEE